MDLIGFSHFYLLIFYISSFCMFLKQIYYGHVKKVLYFPGAGAIVEILFQNMFPYEFIKYAFLFV